MSCPRNKHIFRCDQNGPPARREEGAYLERYVTDEQRSRRPIFIATLRAAASWLFFRVARSSRIDLDMLVARALKNSQLTCGERYAYFGDRTLVCGFSRVALCLAILLSLNLSACVNYEKQGSASPLATAERRLALAERHGSNVEGQAGEYLSVAKIAE